MSHTKKYMMWTKIYIVSLYFRKIIIVFLSSSNKSVSCSKCFKLKFSLIYVNKIMFFIKVNAISFRIIIIVNTIREVYFVDRLKRIIRYIYFLSSRIDVIFNFVYIFLIFIISILMNIFVVIIISNF